MKKIITSVAVLGIILAMTGCEAAQVAQTAETTAETTVETAGETTSETAAVPAVEMSGAAWSEIATYTYDFPVNQAGYLTEDSAISVGMAGEIHCFNCDATDWPKSENSSMCRFGMDVVGDGQIIYTCGNGGNITKSVDGGKTFCAKANFGDTGEKACRYTSFCYENTGVVASASRAAITADGAESWTEITLPADIAAIRMTDANTLYCIGLDFNLYKSVDGGANWESTSLNLPLGTGYKTENSTIVFSVDGENAYTIFCIEAESKLLKSYSTTDGWATCKENTLPELKSGTATIYLNHDGTILTFNNYISKVLTAYSVQ